MRFDGAPIKAAATQLSNGLLAYRIPEGRRDLFQGDQNEIPPVQPWMRNRQMGQSDHPISVEQDVDIDISRPFQPLAFPTHLPFYRLANLQENFDRCGTFDMANQIQKEGLIGNLYRFRLVEAGAAKKSYPSKLQSSKCRLQVLLTVSQIGSKREKNVEKIRVRR